MEVAVGPETRLGNNAGGVSERGGHTTTAAALVGRSLLGLGDGGLSGLGEDGEHCLKVLRVEVFEMNEERDGCVYECVSE